VPLIFDRWTDKIEGENSFVFPGIVNNTFGRFTTKYDDNPYLGALKEFDSGMYRLADISDKSKVYDSFQRFADAGASRDTAFLRKHMVEVTEICSSIFSPYLRGRVMKYHEVIAAMDPDKASGFGFRMPKKGAAIAEHYYKLKELLKDEDSLFTYVPLWQVAPKDEIRHVEKLPRTFQYPPLWFHMWFTKYTKTQNLYLMNDWTTTPSRVGISIPDDWPELVWMMKKRGEDISVDWDVKQFDSSQFSDFRYLCKDVRMEGYRLSPMNYTKDELDHIDKVLEHLYYHSRVRVNLMPDGNIFITRQGMGSGDPNTSIDNSITHIAMLCFVWIYLGFRPWDFPAFARRVHVGVFGDDGIASYRSDDLVAVSFFTGLDAAWKTLFGVPCITNIHTRWSDFTFLGKQCVGEKGVALFTPMVSDWQRLVGSLLYKHPRKGDILTDLQQLTAFRSLLANFHYTDQVTKDLVLRFDEVVKPVVRKLQAEHPHLFDRPDYASCADILLSDIRELARYQKFEGREKK